MYIELGYVNQLVIDVLSEAEAEAEAEYYSIMKRNNSIKRGCAVYGSFIHMLILIRVCGL